MKTLVVVIVFLFVSFTAFSQSKSQIEEDLQDRPMGMLYDGGMEPICSYESETYIEVNFPSLEDIHQRSLLDKIFNQIKEEEMKDQSHLIRNDVYEDTAFLIKNDAYDEA